MRLESNRNWITVWRICELRGKGGCQIHSGPCKKYTGFISSHYLEGKEIVSYYSLFPDNLLWHIVGQDESLRWILQKLLLLILNVACPVVSCLCGADD